MKYPVFVIGVAVWSCLAPVGEAEPENAPVRFASTVQWVVRESSPVLVERGQRLLEESFVQALHAQPMLRQGRYELRRNGNEIVFYVSGTSDMMQSLDEVIRTMIHMAHGRVHAKGQSMVYGLTEQPENGFLDVEVDAPGRGVVAVAAHHVRVRDLLEEIQAKIAAVKASLKRKDEPDSAWSYVLPGKCARKRIDFQFGDGSVAAVSGAGPAVEAVPMAARSTHGAHEVMQALAQQLHTGCEKRDGMYVFTGDCEDEEVESTWSAPSWAMDTTPSVIPAVFLSPAE